MKPIAIIPFVLLVIGCGSSRQAAQGGSSTITVTNTTALDLKNKAVSVSRDRFPSVREGYPLLLDGRDTVPSQLDDMDGDGRWDELFFVAALPPNAKKQYRVQWLPSAPSYTAKTSVRFGKRDHRDSIVQPATEEWVSRRDMPKALGFQKYQTDGPTWENDKVGFRHYLDGRNAKDLFGKLIPAISPENVGISARGAVEDNYHVMAPWGRDILAVGNSNGIGGIGLLSGGRVHRLGVIVDDTVNNVDQTRFRIVTEGPVRSAFQIRYNNWKPADRSYMLTETPSIWPGMYAYHNRVSIGGTTAADTLLLGIVAINATHPPVESRINDDFVAIISHDRHAYNKEWWIGLALIVPASQYYGLMPAPSTGKLTSAYLAKMKAGREPVQYYAVAGWEMSDPGFRDPAYFQRYVEDLARQLAAPLTIAVSGR